MGDSVAFERYFHSFPAGNSVSFAYGVWNNQSLTQTGSYVALTITHHYQGIETKPATTLYNLGDAAGVDYTFAKASRVFLLEPAPSGASLRKNHQNLSPPSLAASARAFTRP